MKNEQVDKGNAWPERIVSAFDYKGRSVFDLPVLEILEGDAQAIMKLTM